MTIEIPCTAGDTVFADLRIDQRKKPKLEDLTECVIACIEIDRAWNEPLFTAVRKTFDTCHIGHDDFGKFWRSDFGKSIFTKNQYLDRLIK